MSYNAIIIDLNRKLETLEFTSLSEEIKPILIHEISELKDVDNGNKNILLLDIAKEQDIKVTENIIKEFIKTKYIAIAFLSLKNLSDKLIPYLNDKYIDKVNLGEFNSDNLEEEIINATVVFASKFDDVGNEISEQAKIVEEVNAELELKNQWMEYEKTIALIFGDLKLILNEKLHKVFSLIIEKFSIENFSYYSANSINEGSLELKLQFSSIKNLEPHIFSQEDEYSPIFAYYNKNCLIIADYNKEVRVSKNPNLPDSIKCSLSIPITANDKTIGVVEFYNSQTGTHSGFDKAKCNFLCKMIGDLHYFIEINLLKDEISASRNEMLDIFNNVNQGIITINKELRINPEYSVATEIILNEINLKDKDCAQIIINNSKDKSKEYRDWLNNVFNMPDSWELLKDLAPKKLIRDEKHLALEHHPIFKDKHLDKIMLVITDITEKVKAEENLKKAEEKHNAKMEMLNEILNLSPNVFHAFLRETSDKINNLKATMSKWNTNLEINEMLDDLFADIHSIKGTCGFMGLTRVRDQFHMIENSIKETKNNATNENISNLFFSITNESAYFTDLIGNFLNLINDFSRFNLIGSEERLHENLIIYELALKLKAYVPTKDVSLYENVLKNVKAAISEYRDNAINNIKSKCEEMISRMSSKLHKRIELNIDISNDAPANYINKLQPILVPILINSIDHGIEPVSKRELIKKNNKGTINITGYTIDAKGDKVFRLEFSDDGAGIDTKTLKDKAFKMKLIDKERYEKLNEKETLELIFIPSLSIKESATSTSGRGYGMDIVIKEVEKLNGSISVESQINQGTKFTITFRIS